MLRLTGFAASVLCIIGLFSPLVDVGEKTFPMSGFVLVTTFIIALIAAKIALWGKSVESAFRRYRTVCVSRLR